MANELAPREIISWWLDCCWWCDEGSKVKSNGEKGSESTILA